MQIPSVRPTPTFMLIGAGLFGVSFEPLPLMRHALIQSSKIKQEKETKPAIPVQLVQLVQRWMYSVSNTLIDVGLVKMVCALGHGFFLSEFLTDSSRSRTSPFCASSAASPSIIWSSSCSPLGKSIMSVVQSRFSCFFSKCASSSTEWTGALMNLVVRGMLVCLEQDAHRYRKSNWTLTSLIFLKHAVKSLRLGFCISLTVA